MKLKIDQLKSDTSGICVKRCPELFRFQEGSKKAEVIDENITLSLEPECLSIVGLCPTGAISVET